MRSASLSRVTKETEVFVELNLDGKGKSEIDLEDRFLKHMLETFSTFSTFDLRVRAKGDLKHHLTEDVAITMGQAFDKALNRNEVVRFGFSVIPMEDALVLVSVDLAKRAYFNSNLALQTSSEFEPSLIMHFLRSFAFYGMFTLHVYQISGSDPHHLVEACFKGLGISLNQATRIGGKTLSVKGSL